MKTAFTVTLVFFLTISPNPFASAALITFEGLLPGANTFYNGGPMTNANGFDIGGAHFANDYSSVFGAWNGFSYSNVVNTTDQNPTNQYAAWPGAGSGGSSSYGVSFLFEPTYITFAAPTNVSSADIANTTWAALTMLNGDTFAKKFGGLTGSDPDFLLLTIEGRTGSNGQGSSTGLIDLYLADYRSSNNALDFIRTGWTNVDLTGLGAVRSLSFSMTGSDVGMFGINTPTYFAIDNISFPTAVPELNSVSLIVATGLGFLLRRKRDQEQTEQ